jgi:hypothetical protein
MLSFCFFFYVGMYGVYFNVDTDADAVECALTFIVNMH